ncbi:MAG: hypothetical protein U9Q03_02220 [Patescibacteria group bacterium]|nr:hypothetical protein [Patescibacteria group bacterium]
MKKRVEMKATLELHDSGQWVLKLHADSTESAAATDAMLNDFGVNRDHMHILVLSLSSREMSDGETVISFNVDEGPDIVGRQSEIRKLRLWKP